jgi:hypothetical protein
MLVALLFANHDKELALKNLRWMEEIGVGAGHDILLVCPSGVSKQDAQRAMDIAERAFASAKLCHLADDCTTGWPFGPNFMFRRTVDYIAHFKLYPFLLLESDAWLLYEDSLDTIEAEYEQAVKKGYVFMGYKEFEGKSGEHMNGVGIYGNINIHAPTALSAPWPQDASQIGLNKMAFDMAGAAEIVPLMHNSRLFQFQYQQEERLLKDTSLSFLNPDAKIFHTEKTGRLVDLLKAKREGRAPLISGDEVKPAPPFVSKLVTRLDMMSKGLISSIYIKTYSGDSMWHEKCLASIDRYCTGFHETVVNNEDHPNGYLAQQIAKLNADTEAESTFILVTDSDTLFTTPVTPQTFMRGGRPIWHLTPKDEVLAADPGTAKWFDVMEKFLGATPQHEFMRRQPFFFPRWLLQAFRQFCWQLHGISVEEYVMAQPNFSEWNCLGFYAWTYHRECFSWEDNSAPLVVRQFWSPHNQPESSRRKLFDEALPEINRILGVSVVQEIQPRVPIQHPATVIKPADGWSTIEAPTARMDLASEMLKKEQQDADKKLKMQERMAKARAARKVAKK